MEDERQYLTSNESVKRFPNASFLLSRKCSRLDLRFNSGIAPVRKTGTKVRNIAYTSRGYIRAHEVTPEKEPQKKGTMEGGSGSHEGDGPCSPEGRRPMRYLIPSYSRKYNAVPDVSLTTQGSFRTETMIKLVWTYVGAKENLYTTLSSHWTAQCQAPPALCLEVLRCECLCSRRWRIQAVCAPK